MNLEDRALLSATAWTVSSLGDTGTGLGTSGDLHYVITQADKTTGNNTINFSVTGTITSSGPAGPEQHHRLMTSKARGCSLTVARSSAVGPPDFGIFTVDTA